MCFSCWLQLKSRQKCKSNYLRILRNKSRWIVEKQPRQRNEGKIKPFSDEEKLREFIATRPNVQEMLKEVPHTEGKWYMKETWISGNEGRATNGKYLDKYKKVFPLIVFKIHWNIYIYIHFVESNKYCLGKVSLYVNTIHMTIIT